MKRGLPLESLEIYKVAMEIGELVWNIVGGWDYFYRKTLGDQFIRAADSIALNISEGYGRFHFKENRNFCYYSRGSAKETLTITEKALKRKLINVEEYKLLTEYLDKYFRLSYGYIRAIGIIPEGE